MRAFVTSAWRGRGSEGEIHEPGRGGQPAFSTSEWKLVYDRGGESMCRRGEIASALTVGEETIKAHVAHVLGKAFLV